jgi:hypothetical protein
MASDEILREIVRNGSDLTLRGAASYSLMRELAQLASQSGAHLTPPTSLSYEFIKELSSTYGRTVAFVDGLDDFKKS